MTFTGKAQEIKCVVCITASEEKHFTFTLIPVMGLECMKEIEGELNSESILFESEDNGTSLARRLVSVSTGRRRSKEKRKHHMLLHTRLHYLTHRCPDPPVLKNGNMLLNKANVRKYFNESCISSSCKPQTSFKYGMRCFLSCQLPWHSPNVQVNTR